MCVDRETRPVDWLSEVSFLDLINAVPDGQLGKCCRIRSSTIWQQPLPTYNRLQVIECRCLASQLFSELHALALNMSSVKHEFCD